MDNLEELIIEIKNLTQKPYFDKKEKMSELDGMADDALGYKFEFGYLGAVLIYQQLTEEIIYTLLNYITVFIRTRIHPLTLTVNYKSGGMLGIAIKELQQTINFENKDPIIKNAQEINRLRNKIVHKLLEKDHANQLQEIALEIKNNFDGLFDMAVKSIYSFSNDLREFVEKNENNGG